MQVMLQLELATLIKYGKLTVAAIQLGEMTQILHIVLMLAQQRD
jgi:hypothetical protein